MLQHKISQGFTLYVHKALKMSFYRVQNLIICSSDQIVSIFPLWWRERTEYKTMYNENSSFLKAQFSEIVHVSGCPHYVVIVLLWMNHGDTERGSEKDEDMAEWFNKSRNFCCITELVLDQIMSTYTV